MPYKQYARLYNLTQSGRPSTSIVIYAPKGKSSGFWHGDSRKFRDTGEHDQFSSNVSTGLTLFYYDIGMDNSGYQINFWNAPFASRAFVLNGLMIMGHPKQGSKGTRSAFQLDGPFDVKLPITWEYMGTRDTTWPISDEQRDGKGALGT